jgi:hypothetical protein
MKNSSSQMVDHVVNSQSLLLIVGLTAEELQIEPTD